MRILWVFFFSDNFPYFNHTSRLVLNHYPCFKVFYNFKILTQVYLSYSHYEETSFNCGSNEAQGGPMEGSAEQRGQRNFQPRRAP